MSLSNEPVFWLLLNQCKVLYDIIKCLVLWPKVYKGYRIIKFCMVAPLVTHSKAPPQVMYVREWRRLICNKHNLVCDRHMTEWHMATLCWNKHEEVMGRMLGGLSQVLIKFSNNHTDVKTWDRPGFLFGRGVHFQLHLSAAPAGSMGTLSMEQPDVNPIMSAWVLFSPTSQQLPGTADTRLGILTWMELSSW